MKLKPDNSLRVMITLLLITVVVCATYVFFFLQVRSANRGYAEFIGNRTFELERQRRLESSSRILHETGSDRERIETYFVTDETVVSFVQFLEDIALNADVDLDISSITVVDKMSGVLGTALSIRLDAKGSWRGVSLFMSLMEEAPFATEIQNVRLSSATQGEGLNDEGDTVLTQDGWSLFVSLNVLMHSL